MPYFFVVVNSRVRRCLCFSMVPQFYTAPNVYDSSLPRLDFLPDLKERGFLLKTAKPDREHVFCSINVTLMGRFTITTKPFSYTKTFSTFRTVLARAATRAGLGGVRFIYFDIVATCVRAFVVQLSLYLKPTRLIDGFGE